MMNIQSPRTDDDAIEQEIKAKGLTSPRVTPADIEANILYETYFTAADGALHVDGDRGHDWFVDILCFGLVQRLHRDRRECMRVS